MKLLLALAVAIALSFAGACGSGDPFSAGETEAGAAGAGEPSSPGGGTASTAGRASSSGGDAALGGGGAELGGGGEGGDAGPLGCDLACTGAMPVCEIVDGKPRCVNPVQPLAGARLELPCATQDVEVPELCESVAQRDMNCPTGGKTLEHSAKLGGQQGVLYDVTVRVRGVLEPKVYEGGEAAGDHFYIGGKPTASNYNTFSIEVSEPAQIYYLNHDSAVGEQYFVFPLDHTKVIRVAGGATITLGIGDPDCAMVKNCKSFLGECQPYVIEGVPPAPAGFSGQFAQLDVVSVVQVP